LSRLADVGRKRSAPDPFEVMRERGERPAQLPEAVSS
jgi:hypothetical protein